MSWSAVGDWLKTNAGTGAVLVGSMLTGNVPGAIAAGVSLVSSATGETDPAKVLERLQTDPSTVIRLKELAVQDEASIREHIRAMHELELTDAQKEQEETQKTIRAGDVAEDWFVRRTRPAQSWASLFAAFAYIFWNEAKNMEADVTILGLLLTLPWAYAGLREVGKSISSWTSRKK